MAFLWFLSLSAYRNRIFYFYSLKKNPYRLYYLTRMKHEISMFIFVVFKYCSSEREKKLFFSLFIMIAAKFVCVCMHNNHQWRQRSICVTHTCIFFSETIHHIRYISVIKEREREKKPNR